jgi:16S rRNA (cytidine1402-2'-O)-methyltransferase
MDRELNFEGKKPLLYLVATPIGNLSEFPPRAKEVLSTMDFIACEDTRNSGLLLKHFSIDKPLISCHEHNEETASDKIVSLLLDGKKVAYVSDAGYPALSDPGRRLAARCIEQGIKVSVINGPSAAICGLIGSGMDSTHFYFHGFLASKSVDRLKELRQLTTMECTLIFYEAPHRIAKTIEDMLTIFGGERKVCLCRELTKTHEEYIRCTLQELTEIDPASLLGEMVIVVEGAKAIARSFSDDEILSRLQDALVTLRPKEAVKKISADCDVAKNRVYDIYLSSIKAR